MGVPTKKKYSTRARARTVPCPKCGAKAGKPCWGGRGSPKQPRKSVHMERIKQVTKLRADVVSDYKSLRTSID